MTSEKRVIGDIIEIYDVSSLENSMRGFYGKTFQTKQTASLCPGVH